MYTPEKKLTLLSENDRNTLKRLVKIKNETNQRGTRARILLRLDEDWPVGEVAASQDMTERAVYDLRIRYQEDGLAALDDRPYTPRSGKLDKAQEEKLKEHFAEHPPATAREAAAHIRTEYGVTYADSGVRKLLNRFGLKWKKPSSVAKLAEEEKQQEFIDLYESLKAGLKNDEAIYFIDAVHPEHQVRPACCWLPKNVKVAVKTSSGRERVNVVGALDVARGRLFAKDSEKADGATVASLLRQMHDDLADHISRVHVILDNARYNHAKCVTELVDELGDEWLHLHYLPPYAPHLNSIERLWGVMHQRLTHNTLYDDFKEFQKNIREFIYETVEKDWDEIKSQVSDNFRVVSHEGYMIYNRA